jgi:hypothetical protein
MLVRRDGMRRYRWFLVLSFVVISSLVAWACGGGGGEKPGTATPPAAASPAGNTPEAGATPSAEGGGGQFSDLRQKFENATFKAVYQITSTGGGEDFSGSMTLYKKGDNLREDLEAESGGETTSITFITTPDTSYVCSEDTQTGEPATCLSAPTEAGQGPGEIVADLETVLTDPNVDIVSTSSRNIAGEDATCYTLQSPDIEGNAEVCLNSEGVPLSTTSTAQGVETSAVATAFSRDVSDSDFEPPFPVSGEIPTTPSGQ